jgi:hypothetical protein
VTIPNGAAMRMVRRFFFSMTVIPARPAAILHPTAAIPPAGNSANPNIVIIHSLP